MKHELEFFPDGTPIDDWFYEIETPELSALGKQYPLTDYGILPDGQLHTKEIQSVIDFAAKEGGGSGSSGWCLPHGCAALQTGRESVCSTGRHPDGQ